MSISRTKGLKCLMYDNCFTCYQGLWMWNVTAHVLNKQSRTNESDGIPV